MSTEEASAFAKLSQIDRNAAVSVLAIKAGWKTRLVVGTDGQAYTTFCPTDI